MESETSRSKCCFRPLVSISKIRKYTRYSSNSFLVVLLSINFISIILALTGFVCTHKIQAEEECLSSNVLCYECDSRYDPNCADPFDSFSATLDPVNIPGAPRLSGNNDNSTSTTSVDNKQTSSSPLDYKQTITGQPNETSSTNTPQPHQPKKYPAATICHGCCVKLTSKTLDGAIYVKRTCTTNLQINYFMVGLVCMKESGDRGKMCFCETDYCNGKPSILPTKSNHLVLITLALSIILYLVFSS